MPAPTIVTPSPPTSRRAPRVEYLDFHNVPDYREYRFAVYGPDGPTEFLFRIATAAFDDGRVRLQDGAEVCYLRLLQAVAAGETLKAGVVTIDSAELASYRDAHARAPKHQPWTPASPTTPQVPLRAQPRPPSLRLPVAPLVTQHTEPAFREGQRVCHAVFGVGVTGASRRNRTTISFDETGPRTFVTSLLELEVLSAPHTWETSKRGKNRPRETALPSL